MNRRYARYPFLDAAREAVDAHGVDLGELVAREASPVVDRAVERVRTALAEGTTGRPSRNPRVELLSYPVARVLVSLVDERLVVQSYARAEASDAHERFLQDLEGGTELKSTGDEGLTLRELLAEFDLASDVEPLEGSLSAADRYRIAVGSYLELARDCRGEKWRLVNRALADGAVPVDREELLVLLRGAVQRRVSQGLPLAVPESIAGELDAEATTIRETLAELDLTTDIDTVVPDLFPPCMRHLLDRIRKGDHLEHHSRFAITAFLASVGMSTDDIVECYEVNPGFEEDVTRYQVDHIRGETGPTEYTPPSCATMQSYGDCVNMDDRCETIAHPLQYYEAALDAVDEDEYEEWSATDAG